MLGVCRYPRLVRMREAGEAWCWNVYWNGQLSRWHGREAAAMNSVIWDTGLTPSIRLESVSLEGSSPYLELGIGAHVLSETRINHHRAFSNAFQFGEFVGGGLRFGHQGTMWWGVRIQHISNGGIKEPNDGVTFVQGLFERSQRREIILSGPHGSVLRFAGSFTAVRMTLPRKAECC
jgi:hypothetical protein